MLLPPETECTRYLTSFLNDLRPRMLINEKFWENLKTECGQSLLLILLSRNKKAVNSARKLKKLAIEFSMERPLILLRFIN